MVTLALGLKLEDLTIGSRANAVEMRISAAWSIRFGSSITLTFLLYSKSSGNFAGTPLPPHEVRQLFTVSAFRNVQRIP